MMKKATFVLTALALGLASVALAAYPERPITMIVPFAAGGPTDVTARIVGEHMSRTLGQQIVIENVAGAGGTTGISRAAASTADGYTIMMGHMGTHGAAPAVYPNLKYNPTKDFEPIGLAAGTPILIVAKKDFPANNLKEFIAYLKANAKKLNEAHAGVGSVSFTTCLLLNSILKVKPTTIPYQGTGPAMNALVGGQVDYMCDQIVNAVPQIKGGTIKTYAIATPERNPALPDVPTTKEAGVQHYVYSSVGSAHNVRSDHEVPSPHQTCHMIRSKSGAEPHWGGLPGTAIDIESIPPDRLYGSQEAGRRFMRSTLAAAVWDVFARYVLNAPTEWAYEIAYMAMGAHALLGMAYTLRESGHIRHLHQ
jgi:tripartite-type tricarboxylate transporter receptor subunit TctC